VRGAGFGNLLSHWDGHKKVLCRCSIRLTEVKGGRFSPRSQTVRLGQNLRGKAHVRCHRIVAQLTLICNLWSQFCRAVSEKCTHNRTNEKISNLSHPPVSFDSLPMICCDGTVGYEPARRLFPINHGGYYKTKTVISSSRDWLRARSPAPWTRPDAHQRRGRDLPVSALFEVVR
jgi:hypothetical protein